MENVVQFVPNLDFNETEEECVKRERMESLKVYLDVLFGYCGDGLVPLRGFEEKGGAKANSDLRWVVNDESLVENVGKFCDTSRNRKAAAFLIPGIVESHGQAGYEHVRETAVVIADFDSGDVSASIEHIRRHIGTPSLVVNSGGVTEDGQEKAHLYLRLSEAASGADLKTVERIRELIAVKAGGDPAMGKGKLAQPLRIVSSQWQKYGGSRPVNIRESNPRSEYDLAELLDMAEGMPAMPGMAVPVEDIFSMDFSRAGSPNDRPISSVLNMTVREHGQDGITRFDAASAAIGYIIWQHHSGLISEEKAWELIRTHNAEKLDPPWSEDRLEREVKALWAKHVKEHGLPQPPAPKGIIGGGLPSYSLQELLADHSETPDDLIEPRFLTPGGMLVVGGAPKVGKTDWLANLLINAAAGGEFVGLKASRPLRIFYGQAELDYFYLKERMHAMAGRLSPQAIAKASRNLFITPRFKGVLDAEGVKAFVDAIKARFGDEGPDVIVLDPIRNVFYGGEQGASENDAQSMLYFLKNCAEEIREQTNPDAGIILVHHTRKLGKKALEEDPMQALAGSGALRGYYTTGCVIWKPDENEPERKMHFELRNGAGIDQKTVVMESHGWTEINPGVERIYGKEQHAKGKQQAESDAEFIVSEIRGAAEKGQVYVKRSFSEYFANMGAFGSSGAVSRRIDELCAKGVIKFFDGAQVGLERPGNRSDGYLCVDRMEWGPFSKDHIDPDTGESYTDIVYIKPTHYKPLDGKGKMACGVVDGDDKFSG